MFVNKQKGIENNDLNLKNLDYYLDLTKDFKSSFKDFTVKNINGFNVIDESLSCEVGYKARSGEFLIQELVKQGIKELVYVQPRSGYAGISLSWLCNKYNLNYTAGSATISSSVTIGSGGTGGTYSPVIVKFNCAAIQSQA